jgi:ADP-ribose pyrophosphatase YjhB (NUDIX family)
MPRFPEYRFCPLCGGELEYRSRSLLTCTRCGYRFYQNAKPAVGAMITRELSGERQVLLVRRGVEPYRGSWDMPGGFIENGEDPMEALHREIREELDAEITVTELFTAEVDTYPREGVPESASNTLCLYYICALAEDAGTRNAANTEAAETVLTPADDITECRWFPLSHLPEDIAFDGNNRALEKLKNRY